MPRHSPCAHVRFTFRFSESFFRFQLILFSDLYAKLFQISLIGKLCSFLPDFKFEPLTLRGFGLMS